MARAWLVDSRTIASKVKNPTRTCDNQIKYNGPNRECPNCHHHIDNRDVSCHWPGLPAGVKFDPSDAELIEHLAAKCGVGDSKPHAFIDEFIPTLCQDKGICYTHPENLPGAKKDGSSIHFYHRTFNAYATSQRKRRKVYNEDCSNEEQVRWHKTGKTKPVMENGVQKGCKKIMVLYRSTKKGSKPDKLNWVMHQYHLGTDEDEKEDEYVVSKVFYQQQKQIEANDVSSIENSDSLALQTNPRTPNTNPPNPPRPGEFDVCDDVADDTILQSSEKKIIVGAAGGEVEDELGYSEWLAGESQGVEASDFNGIDETLLCNEIFDSASHFLNSSGANNVSYNGIAQRNNEMIGNNNVHYGIADLENLEFDSAPLSQLPDLHINSEDSVFGWLDRF